jgi:hypothetical protein
MPRRCIRDPLLAAEALNRRCFTVEIDLGYCDAIRARHTTP